MMGSSPARQTTTEQDETAGDKKLTILKVWRMVLIKVKALLRFKKN
jgi:hypothetical protein